MRGLDILRLLVDARRPLGPTEIAEQVGLHQSSVSRILATLAEAGYVRKVSGRRFRPDFGVLQVASAVIDFPIIRKPRAAMEQAAALCPGMLFSLSMLWRGSIIYFLRTAKGVETVDFWGAGFALHLSAPGLRMLLDRPAAEAEEILRDSRKRHGWARTTALVPATESATLTAARALLDHDTLILDGWYREHEVGAAIPIDVGENEPMAISISGRSDLASHDTLRLWLHEARREVENAMRPDDKL